MPSNDVILTLKRKALACKKEGDIEAAKLYLRQAKQLEHEQSANVCTNAEVSKELEEHNASTDTKEIQNEENVEEMGEGEQGNDRQRYEDPVNDAIDAANLEELDHKNGVQFTDNELIDYETMQDMREIMSEHFPTEAFYQERVMANKRAALEKKQANDIPAAKKRLMVAKQLEKACLVLFLGALTSEKDEDDGEDYSLLDELVVEGSHAQNDDGFFEQLFGRSATVLELDDLDDMDAALLKDMMEAGMQVPSVEDVLQSAEERKSAAVAFKKDGKLEAAKAALLESKRLTGKANQLASLLQTIRNGFPNDLDPELALGDLLKDDDEKKRPQRVQEETTTPKKLLSSAEYREQAVQHKQRGNKDAAIAALRLYKEALVLEEKAKIGAQKEELIVELQKEAVLASEQARRFAYFSHFVDEEVGSRMTSTWKLYAKACMSHVMLLKTDVESVSFPIQRRLEENGIQAISDPDLSFVGTSCDPSECRIEVSIVELVNLQNNKCLRERINRVPDTDSGEHELVMPDACSIRVDVTIHLPKNADVADDSEQVLSFTAKSLSDDTYVFAQSQHIHAERGASRFAKLFARRLARRRCVAVEVFYSHTIVTKGIFSNSSTTEEFSLGSAGLELSALQEKNCIVVDLPFLEGRREVGGNIRLAIRSGSPFSESSTIGSNDPSVETTGHVHHPVLLERYSQLVFPR